MKDFIKILVAPDGAQVAFLTAKDPQTGQHIFMGLTTGKGGEFVDTRVGGTEEQMRHLFDTVNQGMIDAMRIQASGELPARLQ